MNLAGRKRFLPNKIKRVFPLLISDLIGSRLRAPIFKSVVKPAAVAAALAPV